MNDELIAFIEAIKTKGHVMESGIIVLGEVPNEERWSYKLKKLER